MVQETSVKAVGHYTDIANMLKKCVNGVMVDMLPEEEAAIRNEWTENEKHDRNNVRLSKIRDLEAKQCRAVREAILGLGTERLQEIERQISSIRRELEA